MKRAIVYHKHAKFADPNNSAGGAARALYERLRLPALPARCPVPWLGKIAIPVEEGSGGSVGAAGGQRASQGTRGSGAGAGFGGVGTATSWFDDRRAQIAAAHLSSMPEVLKTFNWLYTSWEGEGKALGSLGAARFVETKAFDRLFESVVNAADDNIPSSARERGSNAGNAPSEQLPPLGGLVLPCDMSQFAAVQHVACERFTDSLRIEWRHAFAEQLVDNVQDVFDFFESTPSVYFASLLCRLLKHFEVRMAHQLRSAVLASLDDWLAFVKRFTENDPTSSPPTAAAAVAAAAAAAAAAVAAAGATGDEAAAAAAAEAATAAADAVPPPAWGRPAIDFAVTGREPLFHVELIVEVK